MQSEPYGWLCSNGVICDDKLVDNAFLTAPHHAVLHRAIKDTELLTKHGIEIVDLSGMESTNDRAAPTTIESLTGDYLSLPSAVIVVMESKGLTAARQYLFDLFSEMVNEAKNRAFFVVNMFDRVPLSELGKDTYDLRTQSD